MESLLYVGLVHSLFIMLFLLSKPHKSRSEYVIILWMIFLCLPVSSDLLASPHGYNLNIPLLRDMLPYSLTFGPLLILYTNLITGGSNWSRAQYFVHFSPFVAACIYKMIFVPGWDFNPNLDPENTLQGNLLSASILASMLSYSVATLIKLKKHKLEVLDQFSSLSTEISLRWLKWLAVCLIASSFIPFIAMALSMPELLHQRVFAILVFMFILSFFGLKQLQIFNHIPQAQSGEWPEKVLHPALRFQMETREPVTPSYTYSPELSEKADRESESRTEEETETKEKYQRSGLTNEKSNQILQMLEAHMAKEKPHLDTNLTADKLAAQLGIQRHHLTQIFCEQLDKNFYLFINEHRVEAVRELLTDRGSHSVPLIEIAHQCGFNSKSTFNKVFKSVTPMTPSQYRKSI